MRRQLGWLLLLALLLNGKGTTAQTLRSFSPAQIDSVLRAEWKKAKMTPAPRVDDARFLRRAWLDIVGIIPPPETVKAFLADTSPDKRSQAMETLLASPRYADYWTGYWENVLMGKSLRLGPIVDRGAFRQWLQTQFAQNVPWNQFVVNLLTATGQNSKGGSYLRAAGVPMREEPTMEEGAGAAGSNAPLNGAVNWTLKYLQTPADLAGNASRIFLGVQIQCAQCHDHKTEKWKQEDFRRFTACFSQVRPDPIDRGQVQGVRRVVLRDSNRMPPRFLQRRPEGQEYRLATPTALDGTDFSTEANRRQALAAWMTAPQNPWFAEAIVNRMWAHLMGRGFVEPIDDFRPTNPAVMPALLQRIAEDFKAHHYDLKHLIRTLCATQAYQLASVPPQTAQREGETLWASYPLKPLGSEELLNSLVQATHLEPVLQRVAGGNLGQIKFALQRQFTFLFDTDEEMEAKDFAGTIPQTLLLLNGNITNRGVTVPGAALSEVMAMPGGDREKVEALYLRTLSRPPTAKELSQWLAFLEAPREAITTDAPAPPADPRQRRRALQPNLRRNNGPDPLNRLSGRPESAALTPRRQAYEDIFWALLNSSEFVFNH